AALPRFGASLLPQERVPERICRGDGICRPRALHGTTLRYTMARQTWSASATSGTVSSRPPLLRTKTSALLGPTRNRPGASNASRTCPAGDPTLGFLDGLDACGRQGRRRDPLRSPRPQVRILDRAQAEGVEVARVSCELLRPFRLFWRCVSETPATQ